MKQSSIEWYLEQVNILDYRYNGRVITLGEYVGEKSMLELKAKEMHKQEIIDAFSWNVYGNDYTKDGIYYYKNTYEKEN